MNWNDLLNSTEFHALVGGAVTAFIAWLRRKLEIDKINQKHAADLQDLRDTYEARMLEKDSLK